MGSTAFHVSVVTELGTTCNYSLSVERPPSSDASISLLTLSASSDFESSSPAVRTLELDVLLPCPDDGFDPGEEPCYQLADGSDDDIDLTVYSTSLNADEVLTLTLALALTLTQTLNLTRRLTLMRCSCGSTPPSLRLRRPPTPARTPTPTPTSP